MRPLLLLLLLATGPALASETPAPSCRFTLETGPAVLDPDGKPAVNWIVTCRKPAQKETDAKSSRIETPVSAEVERRG